MKKYMRSPKKRGTTKVVLPVKAKDIEGGLNLPQKQVILSPKTDTIKAARIIKTADVTKHSTRQVQRVLKGEQKNDTILEVFMQIEEGENALLEEVKRTVPFN